METNSEGDKESERDRESEADRESEGDRKSERDRESERDRKSEGDRGPAPTRIAKLTTNYKLIMAILQLSTGLLLLLTH